MPCPRPKRYQQGKRIPYDKRVKLWEEGAPVQDAAQAAPGEAQPASAPPPVSQRVGCQDWEMPDGVLLHVGCGGSVKASKGLKRRFCVACKAEWWHPGKEWKRI